MNKRTRFILMVLALLTIISATIFLINKFRIGADTVILQMPSHLTRENVLKMADAQAAELNSLYNEIKLLKSSPDASKPENVYNIKMREQERDWLKRSLRANNDWLVRYDLQPTHADLTPEEPTPAIDLAKSAKETAAKERSDYAISVAINYCHPLTPGQSQEKKIEELQSIYNQSWDQAKAIYDAFDQDSTNPARIKAPLQLFKDKMAPYLVDGVLPVEVQKNLVENFLAEDGINMETSLMVSKDSANAFFDSIIGLKTGKFDREKFEYELTNTIIGSKVEASVNEKFTAEQLDILLQSMFPSYATAVAMYQEQMDLYAKYSDEIRIAGLANYMANGDVDRYEIIYNYLVEHKDAKMMDWFKADISIETKMGFVNNYLKANDIFRKAYGSSISINSNTGHVEYTSVLREKIGDNKYRTLGYVSFDPTDNSFDAEIPIEFGNKNITLFSDPRTGDVWAELGNADNSPLVGEGKIGLVSVTVSKSGKIGGQFRLFNRLFAYNPSSGAFEMPVRLSNRAQFTIDTKGNVKGNVGIFGDNKSSSQGALFFDRNGNMGVTLDIRTATDKFGRISTALIMYSKDGGIAGSMDMGKMIGGSGASSFFVSFDKSGLTGVNIPFGSWAGKPFGLGVGIDGSLSLGGFIPIAGIPTPVGIAQDSSGGFRLAWPGGSLGIIKGDSRPQNPPELKIDKKNGFYDASVIYFRHSFKKAFKAVRVYQVPPETIGRDEQIARGDMIIKVYAELLGRNPSIGEFLNWYFYSGHELYAYPDHNQKDYRMKATEAAVRRVIKSGPYKNMSAQFKFPNKEEYNWIKSGKDPLTYPKRPKETLTKNPFSDGSLVINGQKVNFATMNDLVNAVNNSSKNDDKKIVDQTGPITDVGAETPLVDDQTTNSDTPASQSNPTTSTNGQNQVSAKPDLPPEKKMADPVNDLSQVPVTNDLSKSRVEVVKKATTELNKISLTLKEKQLAERMIEITKQQIEAENQIIALLNKLESQGKVSSVLIGAHSDTIDELNKAQIDNSVRNKALSQISAKVTDKDAAENIYTQNRALELANQDLQKNVDQKQAQFSFFGWLIKLFKNLFN